MYQFLEISNLEKFYSENADSIVFAFLAFRNLEQGNPEKALAICEKGVEKHPEYPFGHFILGLCHYHLKNHSKAKRHLEFATTFDDKNPQAWKLLGEINEKLNLPILADECNLKYYLLDSFNADALERYQKQELIDFDVFKKGSDLDFSSVDKLDVEEKENSEILQDESHLDTFFDKHFEEDAKAEVTKEKGDFLEMDKETETEYPETERIEKEEKQIGEEESVGGQTEVEEKPIDYDLDKKDLEEIEETPSPISEESFSEPKVDEPGQSDELFDFKSVVKDIITENQEDNRDILEEGLHTEKVSDSREDISEEDATSETATMEEDRQHVSPPPILTPTVGEIYVSQGRFEEAIDVFEQLLEQDPDNQKLRNKIKGIKAIIEKQKSSL